MEPRAPNKNRSAKVQPLHVMPCVARRCLTLDMCTGSIQALLSAPNPDDPLAENIAKHWKENEQEAVATGENSLFMIRFCSLILLSLIAAKEWTRQYASA